MIHMPDSILDQLLALFTEIEEGRPWPTQMLVGIVAALAKHPEARHTTEYRPITIFSLAYRVWGSIRSRQCLELISHIAPYTMMGNMPKKSAKHVWFHVQEAIEYAMHQGNEISGAVIDIVKCFNALPRRPLLAIANHVGIPLTVTGPWASALQAMTRRFTVRQAVGPALPSNNGLPQGDGVSVVGMALCNLALDAWVTHRFPRCQVWSYVDNIETLTSSSFQAVESLEALTQFCQVLHLQVDATKTYAWSNSAAGRKHLREVEIQCKLYARDLGGHINYSRLATNRTIQDKITLLKPFWIRLARSQAPVTQKEYALQTAAWSNLFFGIATVQLGDAHFVKLRTQATRGIGTAKHGANPMLQLSCISPTKCDPEFYCVFHTVMSFRQYHTPDMSYAVLNALANGDKTSPGPCNSLLHALHKLGWAWYGAGCCQDEAGEVFHLQDSPVQDLADRLHQAWHQRVFALMEQQRPTMRGIVNADCRLTRASYLALPAEQAGAVRCLLNGTSGVVDSDKCRYCQDPDSAIHRHWYCPAFNHIRDQFALGYLKDTAEPCLLAHGWLPKAPALPQLQRSLARLPDVSDTHALPPEWQTPPEGLYLFTDGGCLHPAEPDQRVATWGFVIWTPQGFWEGDKQ